MCGIYCRITKAEIQDSQITSTKEILKHRGPDSQSHLIVKVDDYNVLLIHDRLHINGNDKPQPFVNNELYLLCNGEIYNDNLLRKKYKIPSVEESNCFVILQLYEKLGSMAFVKELDGQFSFVLLDRRAHKLYVCRDQIGITPLYYGKKMNADFSIKEIVVSSEMKAIVGTPSVNDIKICYPRTTTTMSIHNSAIVQYHDTWMDYHDYYQDVITDVEFAKNFNNFETIQRDIYNLLNTSVITRLNDLLSNGVEFGVLLSGGLDSSIIAALVQKTVIRLHMSKIKTFSIGMNQYSEDLIYAREVAQHIDSEHHEFIFSAKEGIDSIQNVIYNIETFDTTSVRASTPMYILSKKIKEMYPNMKVLFSGEGADELFLSYVYGKKAPTSKEFLKENLSLIQNIHRFDCLRANKSCMAHGMEVRVPFLDSKFVDYILKIPTTLKEYNSTSIFKFEKQLLRLTFQELLPEAIVWRKKEQFSDGMSTSHSENQAESNWITAIKNHTKKYNYKNQLNNKYSLCLGQQRYSHLKPETYEQLYYRDVFCKYFVTNFLKNTSEFTVRFWEPKWCDTKDPSAREYEN